MDDFKTQVKNGFIACKSDISTLSNENKLLKEKIKNLEIENQELKNNYLEINSKIKGLEIALNYIKEFNSNLINNSNSSNPNINNNDIINNDNNINYNNNNNSNLNNSNINNVDNNINDISNINNSNNNNLNTRINKINNPNINNNEIRNLKNQDPYEALLAFKAKVNKREILKQKLVSMISENGINLSELKFLFVEHFRYCSKATFYNYIKELEYEKIIIQKRENNKSYLYLLNSMNNQI